MTMKVVGVFKSYDDFKKVIDMDANPHFFTRLKIISRDRI